MLFFFFGNLLFAVIAACCEATGGPPVLQVPVDATLAGAFHQTLLARQSIPELAFTVRSYGSDLTPAEIMSAREYYAQLHGINVPRGNVRFQL